MTSLRSSLTTLNLCVATVSQAVADDPSLCAATGSEAS
jgi:hypothetical protein